MGVCAHNDHTHTYTQLTHMHLLSIDAGDYVRVLVTGTYDVVLSEGVSWENNTSFTLFFGVIDSIISASKEPQSKTTELESRLS